MTQRKEFFSASGLRPTFTELEKRAAHIRLLTEFQSISALCTLLLRANPTPARPAAAAASSPDSLRKYLLSELGQESCRTADDSWMRVSETQQISTFSELRVIDITRLSTDLRQSTHVEGPYINGSSWYHERRWRCVCWGERYDPNRWSITLCCLGDGSWKERTGR